jgi:hypothetical protein
MGFAPSANAEECAKAARHRIDKMNGVWKCANVQRKDWVVRLLPTLYDWRMIKTLNLPYPYRLSITAISEFHALTKRVPQQNL